MVAGETWSFGGILELLMGAYVTHSSSLLTLAYTRGKIAQSIRKEPR